MTIKWVDALVNALRPRFGGIPTFVEDHDHLLDMAELREALRAAGMTLSDWDGLPASLAPLKILNDSEMPLLVVSDSGRRHIVESCLQDYRWETVSIGNLMPRFAPDIAKAIPISQWDSLLSLHAEVRQPRPAHETSLLIGRALYGADPEFLRHGDGWIRLLTHIAVSEEPLPLPVARAILEAMPPPWTEIAQPETLSDTGSARTALRAVLDTSPGLYERASRAERLLFAEVRPTDAYTVTPATTPDLIALWDACCRSPQDVLQFGQTYAQAHHANPLPETLREEIYRRFVPWLKQNYSLILSAPNPSVLRVPTLLDTLHVEIEEEGGERLALFVVDALGLAAWERVRERWQADGIIARATTRAAFALLPTITSLSRRSLFERTLPSQFSNFSIEAHSQALERKLWKQHFGDEGEYFVVGETTGFQDSLTKGKQRLCVMDVTWDKKGHSIDLRTESLYDAANIWASRTPLRAMVQDALASGYRVIVTADHGQVECKGKGKPNVGALSEERYKRVILFQDKTVCNNAMNQMNDWTDNFRPMGLPPTMFPLFASEFHSFDLRDAPTVSHGGLSLEETLVPVAEVWK